MPPLKKILYLSFNNPDGSPGVLRKEYEFCSALGEACRQRGIVFHGRTIYAAPKDINIGITDSPYYLPQRVHSALYHLAARIPIVCSVFRIRPVFKAAYTEIASFQPDIILWRYNITTVPGFFNPKRISPALLVSEHQTKELEELRATPAGRILALIVKVIDKHVFRNIDAVVGVTSEIAVYETQKAVGRIPTYVMGNGIETNRYPLTHPSFSRDRLRMLYVGSNTTRWHGLDRLLEGIARYPGDVKIELHLAGTVSADIIHLTEVLGIKDKVFLHGYQSGTSLDRLYDTADIAVGTLALHRIGLRLGVTLKVREYTARGIPFIIAYKDEDLADGLPFYLALPADESPVSLDEVIAFTHKVYAEMGDALPEVMHRYAKTHMDYGAKAHHLLDFMETLANQHTSSTV